MERPDSSRRARRGRRLQYEAARNDEQQQQQQQQRRACSCTFSIRLAALAAALICLALLLCAAVRHRGSAAHLGRDDTVQWMSQTQVSNNKTRHFNSASTRFGQVSSRSSAKNRLPHLQRFASGIRRLQHLGARGAVKSRSKRFIFFAALFLLAMIAIATSAVLADYHSNKPKKKFYFDKNEVLFVSCWDTGIINTYTSQTLACKFKFCFGFLQKYTIEVPPADVVKSCKFAKGIGDSVPMLMRKVKGTQEDNNFWQHVERCARHQFEKSKCLLNIEDGNCATCPDGSGWGSQHNAWLFFTLHALFKCDGGYLRYYYPQSLHKHLLDQCKSPYYDGRYYYRDFEAANALLFVLAKHARCLLGYKRYCLNPCLKPGCCLKEKMTSICVLYEKHDNPLTRKIHPYFDWAKPVYWHIRYCVCIDGFMYDILREKCIVDVAPCQQGNECLHNGKCVLMDQEMEHVTGRKHSCQCPPAWQGLRSELQRDPCLEPNNARSCNQIDGAICARSPDNELTGFKCLCPAGFYMARLYGLPICEDINECAVSAPCSNDATCLNTVGSFKCRCFNNYTGPRCEVPPPTPHWLPWQPWSACSSECDVGVQVRHRLCSRLGGCGYGLRDHVRRCAGKTSSICSTSRQGNSSRPKANKSAELDFGYDIVDSMDDPLHMREFELLEKLLKRQGTMHHFIGVEQPLVQLIYGIAIGQAALLILLVICCTKQKVKRARLYRESIV